MSAKSEDSSLTPAAASLLLTLKVPNYLMKLKKGKVKMASCVPSWNELLGMQHWARAKRKEEIQAAILSALRESLKDCSMKTICPGSSLAILCATAEQYLQTRQTERKLKTGKGKPQKVRKSTR